MKTGEIIQIMNIYACLKNIVWFNPDLIDYITMYAWKI